MKAQKRCVYDDKTKSVVIESNGNVMAILKSLDSIKDRIIYKWQASELLLKCQSNAQDMINSHNDLTPNDICKLMDMVIHFVGIESMLKHAVNTGILKEI